MKLKRFAFTFKKKEGVCIQDMDFLILLVLFHVKKDEEKCYRECTLLVDFTDICNGETLFCDFLYVFMDNESHRQRVSF